MLLLGICAIVDVPDSPYFRCTNGEVRTYRYDCCKFWRCESGLWTVENCPEGLLWSNQKKQCVSDTVQCGDRWVPETVGQYMLVLKMNSSQYSVNNEAMSSFQ